jgi:phospholipid/cholesterol/gamma-HCH transport system ATP-binding protein
MAVDPEGRTEEQLITVEGLTVGYGSTTVLEDVSFSVHAGEIMTILGASGCGKTTLLRAMIGLLPPMRGRVEIAGGEITTTEAEEHLTRARSHIGMLFQTGALLGSFTVGENVALPLREFTDLPEPIIGQLVRLKLDLVRLGGYEDFMPAELSGGMQKRAGLARAIVLDPKILFCDEPASGLDPETALEIDELLLELNSALNVTMVVVTHELASIQNISSRCIMLDRESKGIIATGTLDDLLQASENERVHSFFRRRTDRQSFRERYQ